MILWKSFFFSYSTKMSMRSVKALTLANTSTLFKVKVPVMDIGLFLPTILRQIQRDVDIAQGYIEENVIKVLKYFDSSVLDLDRDCLVIVSKFLEKYDVDVVPPTFIFLSSATIDVSVNDMIRNESVCADSMVDKVRRRPNDCTLFGMLTMSKAESFRSLAAFDKGVISCYWSFPMLKCSKGSFSIFSYYYYRYGDGCNSYGVGILKYLSYNNMRKMSMVSKMFF